MINFKLIKDNPEILIKSLKKRNFEFDINNLIIIDKQYKEINSLLEKNNNKRNVLSKNIAIYINENKNDLISQTKLEVDLLNKEIDKQSKIINELKEKIQNILISIPNILSDSVPEGIDEKDNIEILKKFEHKKFDFEIKSHWAIGKDKDILDLETPSILTGSRFSIYKNKGAKLVRALQNLTLDIHTKNGYDEYILPLILNENSLTTTGQLPKFHDDLFQLNFKNYYLSPTLEVQLINMYRGKTINVSELPIKATSSSFNFRSEAGAAGKDIKGVIRQHQFIKTELINICEPNESFLLLEKMVKQACSILDLLEIPYRVIKLCGGDTGFSSSLTYDIEVWMPFSNNYREISSCSNCQDFQSRRGLIKYVNKENKKDFVHTLNGTGLSIDRLWAAIIENYQDKNGDVIIPNILKKYLGFEKI